jgi:hypothetical protein
MIVAVAVAVAVADYFLALRAAVVLSGYQALQSSQASSSRIVCQMCRSPQGVWIMLAGWQKRAKLKVTCLHAKECA